MENYGETATMDRGRRNGNFSIGPRTVKRIESGGALSKLIPRTVLVNWLGSNVGSGNLEPIASGAEARSLVLSTERLGQTVIK